MDLESPSIISERLSQIPRSANSKVEEQTILKYNVDLTSSASPKNLIDLLYYYRGNLLAEHWGTKNRYVYML